MNKEFCRYAIWDEATGILLVSGEKYKARSENMQYVESFRCLSTRFRKVDVYVRHSVIKGRRVSIVVWFNSFRRKPWRFVSDAGLLMGLN